MTCWTLPLYACLCLLPVLHAQDLFLAANQQPPKKLQFDDDLPFSQTLEGMQALTPGASPNVAKYYKLDDGMCLNGDKPSLFAYHEPADKGTSTGWVIQIGGAPGLDWCIDEAHCMVFGTPPLPGTTCDTNATLCPVNMTFPGFGGPMSTNCTDNPDFCGFNMVQLDPTCSMDMFLGNNNYTNSSTFNYTLHFDGFKVLESAIAKLGELGLNKASEVVFTGVAHGGTVVFLNADRVEAQIRAMNPGLKKFKALPVDGLHPKQWSTIYIGNNLMGPKVDSWLTGAYENIFKMAKADGAISDRCKQANADQPWMCLYVNETLQDIKASLFAVNQMLSVWDSQCQIEGIVNPSILQVACSLKGPGWATARDCNQYPEYCDPTYIGNVTAPKQQQYVDDYEKSGIHKQKDNGGFFHSCYLGSYFHSGWAGTAIWNIVEIGGLSMRQAIGNWFKDEEPAWTTDCTWNPVEQAGVPAEPPSWSHQTCKDWQYDATHTGKPGCYGFNGTSSCCPPDNGACTYFSCTPRPPWTNKWLCNPTCGKIQVYY